MIKMTHVLLGGLVFGFVGCGSTGGTAENDSVFDDTTSTASTIPEVYESTGSPINLVYYLYPNQTVDNGDVVVKTMHQYYTETANGSLIAAEPYDAIFTRAYDGGGNVVISQYLDTYNDLLSEDVIEDTKITSWSMESDGTYSSEIYLNPIYQNDLLTEVTDDGVTMRCIVKEQFASLDIAAALPSEVLNDLYNAGATYSSLQFQDILHIYCGTDVGHTIDSFFASGYGEVLGLYNYADGTSKVEIFEKNGYAIE